MARTKIPYIPIALGLSALGAFLLTPRTAGAPPGSPSPNGSNGGGTPRPPRPTGTPSPGGPLRPNDITNPGGTNFPRPVGPNPGTVTRPPPFLPPPRIPPGGPLLPPPNLSGLCAPGETPVEWDSQAAMNDPRNLIVRDANGFHYECVRDLQPSNR